MNHYRTETVSEALDGKQLRSVLRQAMHLPEGYISHCKFIPRGILLNGAPVHTDALVHTGDKVSVRIDDESRYNLLLPVDTPLVHLVWEDDYLAVVCKQAGIVMHGGSGSEKHPLVANWAAYRWGPEQAFHPVNRLDRGTSGLLCLAKSGYVHDRFRRALHTEDFERVYLAVCEGELECASGVIREPIARTETGYAVRDDGKPSVTEYERLAAGGGVSLVRLTLRTGRTHQIRVHMAQLGHPLCGDGRYGGGDELEWPALHSARLAFTHPVTGEKMQFRQALPPDMAALLAERTCQTVENVLKYI